MKKLRNLSERVNRRNFNLTNKVGGLGRQGVHGPAEQFEKILTRKPFKPKGAGK